MSVNSPELILDLVNAKPGTITSTNPTKPNGNSKLENSSLYAMHVRYKLAKNSSELLE